MASTESLAGGGRTTRTPRIVLAIGIAFAAAVGIAAVTVGAAGGKSDARRAPVVYELVVSRAGQSGAELRTEWISPSTREWRIEEQGRVKIYSNGRYAVVDPQVGTSVRRGSPQVMGYLTRLAVTAEPLDFYLSDGEAATSRRTTDVRYATSAAGATRLSFNRDGVALRAVLVRRLPLAAQSTRRLFAIPARNVFSTMTERRVGAKPTLAVRAYWLGPEFQGRAATTTVEHQRLVPPELAAVGVGADRLEARAYVTMYELPSAGGASSATPGRVPPEGEIQVVSQPLTLATSQHALRAFAGINGDERYDAWPRLSVALANGEPATVVPNLSEGIEARAAGEQRISQFAVITATTLTWVSGGFDLREIESVAAALRPVEGS